MSFKASGASQQNHTLCKVSHYSLADHKYHIFQQRYNQTYTQTLEVHFRRFMSKVTSHKGKHNKAPYPNITDSSDILRGTQIIFTTA